MPVKKALDCGCDRVVLLLTKPETPPREPGKDLRLARLLQKTHPNAAEGLRLRAGRYNQGVALTQRLAKEGRAVILAPDDTCGWIPLPAMPNPCAACTTRAGQTLKSWPGSSQNRLL